MKSISGFKEWLEKDEKAKLTTEKYIRDCKAFLMWIESKGIPLSKEAVLAYKTELGERYKIAGANSIISSLNAYFVYLEREELKVKNYKIQKTTYREEEKELTREEYVKLLKEAKDKNNKRLYYLMKTMCLTGIRVSEIKYITVESLKIREAVVKNKGKMRVILLAEELCKELKEYAEKKNIKSGPVFITRNGRPLDRSNIWKMMKALCEGAKVPCRKVFPHNLRHLFAVTFYRIHKDIVRLADILGHAGVNTTRIYTMEKSCAMRHRLDKLCRLLM